MKIRNAKDLKIELIKRDKTARWLASQLGYSTTYMYRVLADGKEKEIERMKNILKEV